MLLWCSIRSKHRRRRTFLSLLKLIHSYRHNGPLFAHFCQFSAISLMFSFDAKIILKFYCWWRCHPECNNGSKVNFIWYEKFQQTWKSKLFNASDAFDAWMELPFKIHQIDSVALWNRILLIQRIEFLQPSKGRWCYACYASIVGFSLQHLWMA